MRVELPWFRIGSSYGGNQDWMWDPWMHIGGCGALTACDSCIYFARYKGMPELLPAGGAPRTKKEYIAFGMQMKPYLKPRRSGIDSVKTFAREFSVYLREKSSPVTMDTLFGEEPVQTAEAAIRSQLNQGIPVPVLTLKHANKALKDYEWHWYLINGYSEDDPQAGFQVKAVTYGHFEWISLADLWDTGYERTGGLILYRI